MQRINPVIRIMMVSMGLAVLVSGVTFAALQSQLAIVQGNTIQTAIADLKLSANGTTYNRSIPGFSFGGLIPGGQAMPSLGHDIYLRNDGTTGLSLRLSANSSFTNSDNIQLDKVKVILTGAVGEPMVFTLKQLIDAAPSGGVALSNIARMATTQVLQYKVQVQLDANAVDAASASISNLNLIFNAVAVS